MCIWFHKTTAQLSGYLCRLTSWKKELISEPSLTGSCSRHYFILITLSDNRNGYIYKWKQLYWEFSCINIQYVGTERENNILINAAYIFHVQKKWSALSCKNVNRVVSVICSVQSKTSNGNFFMSNRHEQVLWKNIYDLWNMSSLHALCWVSIKINIHLHKASIFLHAHVDSSLLKY